MRTGELRTRTVILGIVVGFVALSLLVAVVILRQVLVAQTAVVTDRSLRTQGQELSRLLADDELHDGESPAEQADRVLSDYYESEVGGSNKQLLVVADGEAIASVGPELGTVTPTIASLTSGGDEAVSLSDGQTASGPVRILARPLLGTDGAPDDYDLVIVLSTEEQQGFVDRAFRDAVLVAAGTLLLMSPLAWLVAGRVLRPVELLAETAEDITAHDLGQRLPVQGTAEMADLIRSFNAMVDRLEGAVNEQRRFLNDASHELRTPLTVMRGHLEVARKKPDKAADATAVALTELDRMGRIVDDLLVLARANEIGFLRLAPVDSDDFLSSILNRVSGMSDHRWVADAVPLGVVHADVQRLDQVMLNLCVNAARHTPPGGEIGIGAELVAGTLRMWVRDTGEGIPASEHTRIFERFQRGSSLRTTGKGAGLGLSIVRAIAEAHGGSVAVASEPGEGATFTVCIPAEPDGVRTVATDGAGVG